MIKQQDKELLEKEQRLIDAHNDSTKPYVKIDLCPECERKLEHIVYVGKNTESPFGNNPTLINTIVISSADNKIILCNVCENKLTGIVYFGKGTRVSIKRCPLPENCVILPLDNQT